MTAKYLEIPINSQAASGTMDLVINSRASTTLANGTNSSLGNVATATNPQGGTGYPTPPGGGVATATGGSQPGNGSGMTVTFTQAGGVVQTNTIVIVQAGAGYAVGDTGTITTGSGTATYVIASVNNSAAPTVLKDSGASFTSADVGNVIYSGTSGVSTIASFQSATQVTCNAAIFPSGGETWNMRKGKQLNSTGATFTSRKVRVGDKVDNTTAGTSTTVAALIDENALTLTNDIFAAAGEFDDNFTITPLATEVYDPTASFTTTVTLDDVVENTSDSVTGSISAILDDFRLSTTQGAMFGDGDTYKVYDQTSTSNKLYQIDQIIGVDRGADNFKTVMYLNSINANADTVTINHSDAGTGRIVASAIETALVRGAVGVNLPEPPGPAVTRVLMPIFANSQVVVESVVVG